MKGSFSLLTCKHPKSALKISKCNILIYLEIFNRAKQVLNQSGKKGAKDDEKIVLEVLQNQNDNINHVKVFNYLYETIRGLLIYAKEGDYDKLFISENLAEILG